MKEDRWCWLQNLTFYHYSVKVREDLNWQRMASHHFTHMLIGWLDQLLDQSQASLVTSS